IRHRLRPLYRKAQSLRRWLEQTTIGEAVSIYTSDAKPLGMTDSWRLADLLRNETGNAEFVRLKPHALHGAEILLRRGTSDADVAVQTFVYGLHVPPIP